MKKESLSKKLTLGVFYLVSSSLATLGISVITVGFIARSLGVEKFGLYSAILSFVGLFQFLSDFGLNKTLIKFGSTDLTKAQISFGNALFLKSLLIIPTILIVTFFGFLAGFRGQDLMILELFTISLLLDSYGVVFSSIRRILGNFKLISFFRIVKTLINLVIIFIALKTENSVLSLASANAILSLVIFLISLLNTLILLKPKLRLRLIQNFIGDSVIFSLSDFFLNVYARISTVLLSFSSDLHSVGIYSAAVRFTRIANLLPNQVKFALLPTMYKILDVSSKEELSNLNPPKAKHAFNIILKYLLIFSIPITISIYFFSESIIHVVFGSKYDLSAPLVKLFSIFIFLRFIETPFTLFYTAMSKHANMVFFQGLTSFINLIANLALIPLYSAQGACIATILSEACFAVMIIFFGRKFKIWSIRSLISLFSKPVGAGFMSVILTVLLFNQINIFIQLVLLLLIYVILLFLVKVFNNYDKELFIKILSKKS